MLDISKIIPVTALVGILLFIFKEFIESRRRKAADRRKLRAVKKILTRECLINYYSVNNLREVFTLMQDARVSENSSRLSISERPAGGHVYMITDSVRHSCGGILNGVQKEVLLKCLIEVAGQDEDFYSKCETVVDRLSEADDIYQSLVHGPEIHFPSSPENYYEGLIDYAQGELNDVITALQDLHLSCTGHEITQVKCR